MTGWWPTDFLAPTRLYGLLAVIVLGLAYVVVGLGRRRFTIRFTTLPLLDAVAPRRPSWRRHVLSLAVLAACASLVVAWARPVDLVRVPKERATIVLAIDTSLSMEATDVVPNRITAAQEAARSFIDELPRSMNVGLVTFDGIARVRVTPTVDRTPVRNAIDNIELGPATAIGEAIFAGLDAIRTAPLADADGEPVPARIIVMTDGKTTVGRPDTDGAAAAVEAGVPVSTIAFGTDRGSIVIDGEIQPVPVEETALRLIAEQTDGRFFRAQSLGELNQVYADIGSSIGFDTEQSEVTERFVGYAVALVLASAALSLLWFQRLA